MKLALLLIMMAGSAFAQNKDLPTSGGGGIITTLNPVINLYGGAAYFVIPDPETKKREKLGDQIQSKIQLVISQIETFENKSEKAKFIKSEVEKAVFGWIKPLQNEARAYIQKNSARISEPSLVYEKLGNQINIQNDSNEIKAVCKNYANRESTDKTTQKINASFFKIFQASCLKEAESLENFSSILYAKIEGSQKLVNLNIYSAKAFSKHASLTGLVLATALFDQTEKLVTLVKDETKQQRMILLANFFADLIRRNDENKPVTAEEYKTLKTNYHVEI